jgi:hypothetical protein
MPNSPIACGDTLVPLALVQHKCNLGELEIQYNLGLLQIPHVALAHLNFEFATHRPLVLLCHVAKSDTTACETVRQAFHIHFCTYQLPHFLHGIGYIRTINWTTFSLPVHSQVDQRYQLDQL